MKLPVPSIKLAALQKFFVNLLFYFVPMKSCVFEYQLLINIPWDDDFREANVPGYVVEKIQQEHKFATQARGRYISTYDAWRMKNFVRRFGHIVKDHPLVKHPSVPTIFFLGKFWEKRPEGVMSYKMDTL